MLMIYCRWERRNLFFSRNFVHVFDLVLPSNFVAGNETQQAMFNYIFNILTIQWQSQRPVWEFIFLSCSNYHWLCYYMINEHVVSVASHWNTVKTKLYFLGFLFFCFLNLQNDYCNCLLMGTPNSVIQPLQKIQSFAARLVLLAPHHHHSSLGKTALASHFRMY